MKPVMLLGSLILSLFIVKNAAAAPYVFDGFAGIVIWVFLGYCAIIIVALLFAALSALRRMLEEMNQKRTSKRIWLR